MDKINIDKNKIIIESEWFDAKHTLECGQVFRFYPAGSGYTLISGAQKCQIVTAGGITTVTAANVADANYFFRYFDLAEDYGAVASRLYEYAELRQGLKARQGIHILRQQLFETIISFIISANNNIPRIKGIIERLCARYGRKMDGFYAFPTPGELRDAAAADYQSLGAGYRAEYLEATVHKLLDSDILERLTLESYQEAVKTLCSLKGVGRKVADCVALFALHHTCCYPVDTWVFKADAGAGDTQHSVRARGMERYGDLAGFAQQYRFYVQRNK